MAHLPLRLAGSSLLAIAVLAAAGCGSSSSTTTQSSGTTDWANGVCSAVSTYQTSLTDAAHALTGNLTKSGLQQAANDVKASTDTFVSDLEGLGKPDTSAGDQAKKILDTLSSNLKKDSETIQNASGSGALEGAAAVTGALATAQKQVTTAFDDLKALDTQGELSQAFAQAPACS